MWPRRACALRSEDGGLAIPTHAAIGEGPADDRELARVVFLVGVLVQLLEDADRRGIYFVPDEFAHALDHIAVSSNRRVVLVGLEHAITAHKGWGASWTAIAVIVRRQNTPLWAWNRSSQHGYPQQQEVEEGEAEAGRSRKHCQLEFLRLLYLMACTCRDGLLDTNALSFE